MGVDKARLRVGPSSVLQRVIAAAAPLGLPLILVCAAAGQEADERMAWLSSFGLPVIPDLHSDLGPLGGLRTALSGSDGDRLLLLACDLPFLTTPFLAYMLSVPATADVVLPRDQHGLQPLCAVYARRCLPELDRHLDQSSLSLVDFVRSVDYRSLAAADYAQFDPEGVLMTNLNTTQDYDRAQAMVQGMVQGMNDGS